MLLNFIIHFQLSIQPVFSLFCSSKNIRELSSLIFLAAQKLCFSFTLLNDVYLNKKGLDELEKKWKSQNKNGNKNMNQKDWSLSATYPR